jgi:antitoxin (DNA-binding transcriptional repressor) of toxin-antitoxin stability system
MLESRPTRPSLAAIDLLLFYKGSLMIVNISDAKANLSKLIDMVYLGEKVIITKHNLPIADLVIHKPAGKRKLGLLKGKVKILDNFAHEDADFNEMFYGENE